MNPYSIVRSFEREMARYAGSKYAVAVDTGTSAIFLSCVYLKVGLVSLPRRTYCSVPCSVIHAGGRVKFDKRRWRGIYTLDPYPIVDAACRFRRGMYAEARGSLWCMSFQYRKHLPIGRGGMILCDDRKAAEWLRLARFSGRHEVPLTRDVPEMIGWQMYMEPERAARGLTLLMNMRDYQEDLHFDYPDLSAFGLYQETSPVRLVRPTPAPPATPLDDEQPLLDDVPEQRPS